MKILTQPLALAYRRLAASPGFTVLAVLMVGVGIGASTAIFSVVNGALLQPLPISRPHEVVRLWETNPERGWEQFSVADANFLDWRRRNRVFAEIGAIRGSSVNLTGGAEPERVQAGRVSAGFFPLLGVEPVLGRHFREEEDRPGGGERVALLSRGLWQRRFASDPEALGHTLTVDGEPHVVVGVVSAPMRELTADLYLPLAASPDADREDHELDLVARLKPGVTLAEARADLESIAAALAAEHPDTNTGWSVKVTSFFDSLVDRPFRRALMVLAGGVACLLLVACANLAGLLLGRSAHRAQELAVRAALGASRPRLIAHLLAESLVVGGLGGALGALLAVWGVDLLKTLDAGNIPRLDQVEVDGRVLAFALGLSVLAGLLSGLVPAFQASGASPRRAMQEGGPTVLGGRLERRLQGGLVVVEVALSLVLLVGAGLLIRSYGELHRVEVGLEVEDRLAVGLYLPEKRYPTMADTADLYRRLLERLGTLPGVESAAAVNVLPFGFYNTVMEIELPGRPDDGSGPPRSAAWRLVTPGYFATLGIPLLAGRAFGDADDSTTADVAIISRRLAELHFPGENPVGRRIGSSSTIVGVAGDVRERGLATEPVPMIYFPFYQSRWSNMPLVLHTTAPAETVLPEVRAALAALDPNLPVSEVRSFESMLADSLAPRRFHLLLLSLFAAVALVLAVGGLYGMLASAVAFRRREIGIRVALGAGTGEVVRMVVAWGMGLTAVGVALGLGAAALLSGTLASLLFGIRPLDPATFAGVALLLATISAVACTLPALAAGRVDPKETLRAE